MAIQKDGLLRHRGMVRPLAEAEAPRGWYYLAVDSWTVGGFDFLENRRVGYQVWGQPEI